MSFARERWKKGARLTKQDSVSSMASRGSLVEEETNEDEVEQYLKNLKSKTGLKGLKGLWSGGKFDNLLDDDKTPDISISSSDEDGKELNVDFKKINLDSDEDEMRIDYLRESSVDVNNNNVVDDDDDDDDLNLMQNIHFAELNYDDVDLTDEENLKKDEQTNDFMPNIYTIDANASNDEDNSDGVSDYQIGNNIKFLSSIDSETKSNSQKDGNRSILSIPASIVTDEIKSESVHSEYSQTHNSKSNSAAGYSQTDFESEVSSKSIRKDRKKKKTKSSSVRSKSSDDKASIINSQKSSENTHHSSSFKSRRSSYRESNTAVSSTTSDFFSSSHTSTERSSKQTPSKSHNTSTERSSKQPPSKSHTRERTSSKSHKKERSRRNKSNTVETQTDDTQNVLHFKYPWQLDRPHNIAAATVAPEALDVLTSYSPAVLAAHDMIKYHFQLLQQHVENSRRLYESYATDSKQSNFQYTTVEDTMRFIKENQPKVATFEEALKEIQEEIN